MAFAVKDAWERLPVRVLKIRHRYIADPTLSPILTHHTFHVYLPRLMEVTTAVRLRVHVHPLK